MGTMRILIVAATLLFSAAQVSAQSIGALGIPPPASNQSGIGLVSGYYCDAQVIEVSFDGGPLIEAPYGTTRGDTVGICGDDDNGFGLLWNYNLLPTGSHTVEVFADGVRFGVSTFNVTTLGQEFLVGGQSETRILGFPQQHTDVKLKWQQGNQNYVVTDYLASRDSYDVTGIWHWYAGDNLVAIFSMFTEPSAFDNSASFVLATYSSATDSGFFSGSLKQDGATLETSRDTGSLSNASVDIQFTGARTATVNVTTCAPLDLCTLKPGESYSLRKEFPFEEDAAPAVSALQAEGESEEGEYVDVAQLKRKEIFEESHYRLTQELQEREVSEPLRQPYR